MKWVITGADKNTGEDKSYEVDAQDFSHAQQLAGRLGILVEHVTPIGASIPAPPMAYAPQPNVYVMNSPASAPGESGLGIASLILGLIAIFTVCVPFASIPLAVIGLILGLVGLMAAANKKKGILIGGIFVCVIPFVMYIAVLLGVISIGASGLNAASKAAASTQPATTQASPSTP